MESGSPASPSGDLREPTIPYARQWVDEEDIAAVARVLRSEFLTQGPAVARFEAVLAEVVGARHAVVVSSGTAALHLTCMCFGMGADHVGVTSPITFAASANCFLYCGAGVAFADVDPVSGLMQPEQLEKVLARLEADGRRPGIVVAVSLAGTTPDLPALAAVCAAHGWDLVEDAAHSLGATYRQGGEAFPSGSCQHTRAAILSFHPVKHVTTGEGGAILTNDDALAARLRRLRSHGIERATGATAQDEQGGWFYEQVELGYHYRLTDVQAALGTSQLGRLRMFLDRRRELARRYAEQLGAAPFTRVLGAPRFDPGHAYHLYIVHFHSAALRRAAYDFLAVRGVRTQVHYIPVYRHPVYERRFGRQALPGAEQFYAGCLSLPLFPALTDAGQDRVLDALAEFAFSHG